MKMIYAKKYNCTKEAWLDSRNNRGDFLIDEQLENNFKIDREELTKIYNDLISKEKNMEVSELLGSTEEKVESLNKILKENKTDIIIKNANIEKNGFYIKLPYIIKNNNKITVNFLEFKEIDKFFKDYSTKGSFMPKLFYIIDIMEHNYSDEYEIEYVITTLDLEDYISNKKVKFLDTIIWNNKGFEENIFSKEESKNKPVYYNIDLEDEPNCEYSRNCKRCQYRNKCGVPKTSILELEVTSNCWRNTKKIIDKINSLKIEDMSLEEVKMLNDTQINKYNAINSKDGISINMDIINNFLSKIENGYVSFDFETYSSILPPNVKYNLYSQIPFSYSLDIVDSNNNISHKEFIVPPTNNDFDSLYKKLKNDMVSDLPIVVYFKSFEIARLQEFQELYPEDKDLIQTWIDNVVDLYEVFEKGGYYDLKFNDSCSLKNVYPVLVDSKAYSLLDINNGQKAMIEYKMLFNTKIPNNENTINNLMEYNRQDTLAQIEIINILKKL